LKRVLAAQYLAGGPVDHRRAAREADCHPGIWKTESRTDLRV
jgi:hypothetical protein